MDEVEFMAGRSQHLDAPLMPPARTVPKHWAVWGVGLVVMLVVLWLAFMQAAQLGANFVKTYRYAEASRLQWEAQQRQLAIERAQAAAKAKAEGEAK